MAPFIGGSLRFIKRGFIGYKDASGGPPPNTKILIDHDHGPIFFGITMFVLLGITYCILLYIIV